MSTEFVRIADENDSEPIEIPTEDNRTIFLSTVSGMCF